MSGRGDFMKKNILKKVVSVLSLGVLLVSFAACGAGDKASAAGSSDQKEGDKIKVKIARLYNSPPYNYNLDDGTQTGFETEVIKEVFRRLPQYEAEFIDTTADDIISGTQTGKYDIGYKTFWYTEERAKNYIIPNTADAATTVGLMFRSENADKIHDLASFADFSGKLVPLAPTNAQYSVVEQWNAENPDHKINLVAAEGDTSEQITWVLEGRYDGNIVTGHYYLNNVTSETGAYHKFQDKLSFFIYKAIPTYPLFYKENTKLAEDYEQAIKEIKADGTYYNLEIQFFGEDLDAYLEDLKKQ